MNTPIEIAMAIFRQLPDPRVERTKTHRLEVIMFIAMCTYLSGGDGFYEMETYARTKKDWLTKNIGMQSVPSHDTFNRVFQMISPSCFGKCLIEFSNSLRKKVAGDVIAFDGKTHRGTKSADASPLHMLNAWSTQNRLVLGQLAVEEKSNEITAMPKLMDMLDIKGCVITADAMHCQKNTATKAIERGADYVLALKGNNNILHEEVCTYMNNMSAIQKPGFESIEKDHGRIETRRCWQSTDIIWNQDINKWTGLQSFILIESVREQGKKIETSRRYYISSLPLNEARVAHSIRSHWHIENSLHWCLDVVFHEDQSRARARNTAKNLSTLRAICLNLIKRIPGKSSMKAKRFQLALSHECLIEALKI